MQPTPPKKPPSFTPDLISDSRNARQASVLLREVTRLRFEEIVEKIRAVPIYRRTKSQH